MNILSKKNFFEFFLNKNILIRNLKVGKVIYVRVLQIKKKYIVVDANLKSESYINIKEFYNKNNKLEVSVGDYVEVLIESLDNGKGCVILSRIKFKDSLIWKFFEKNLKKKIPVKGILISKIKGGISVLVKDIKCFLPYSFCDKKILTNFSFYEDREIPFRILKLNLKKKNVILSRKRVFKRDLIEKRKEFFSHIKKGDLIKGIVKNITNYGVFVDLGYADGLILTRHVSWGPYKYSSEVLSVNQSIIAKILKIDKRYRIFLGIKQLIKDPWKNILLKYKIGSRKFARVYMINNEFIFMILEKGIFGKIKKCNILKNSKDKKILNLIKINTYWEVIITFINPFKRLILFNLYKKI